MIERFAFAAMLLMLGACVSELTLSEDPVASASPERGRALAQERCSRCHALGVSDTSPYPGAQPFRNLGSRWTHDDLTTALRIGIMAQHDEAEPRVPPMKLSESEIEDFLAYIDTLKPTGS